jgi:HSP20 family molecular chaperone IbpA
MEPSFARGVGPSSSRPRLAAVDPLASLEPDTSQVDQSWSEEDAPRHSFIALKPARARDAQLAPSAPQLVHDVWESPHALLVLVDLPGAGPEQISLSLGSHALFLEVTQPNDYEGVGLAAGRHELVIEAPDGLAPDAIDACLSNGLLRVRVSKEHAGARRLSIASRDAE